MDKVWILEYFNLNKIIHRLISDRDYDSIIVMEKGAIIATGTHKELMEECGLYRELAREGI